MKAVITIEYEFKKDAYMNASLPEPNTSAEAALTDVAFLKDGGALPFIEWLMLEDVPHTMSFDVSV